MPDPYRTEHPLDMAGVAILPGTIVLCYGGDRVYQAIGWGYEWGFIARGDRMHFAYGAWAPKEMGELYRPEAALVWPWPLRDIPRDEKERRRSFLEYRHLSGADERMRAAVQVNRDRAARAIGRASGEEE